MKDLTALGFVLMPHKLVIRGTLNFRSLFFCTIPAFACHDK